MDIVKDIIFFLGGMTLSFIIFSLLMIICELLEDVLRKRPNKLLEILFHGLAFLSYIFMFGGLILWLFFIWLSKETAKDEVAKARELWYQMLESEQQTSKQAKAQLALAEEKIKQMEIQHSSELRDRVQSQREASFTQGYNCGYQDGIDFCQGYFEVEPENKADFEASRARCRDANFQYIFHFFKLGK